MSDRIESELVCAICLDTMERPSLVTPCGHSFCRPCICRLRTEDVCAKCPMCRSVILGVCNNIALHAVIDALAEFHPEWRRSTEGSEFESGVALEDIESVLQRRRHFADAIRSSYTDIRGILDRTAEVLEGVSLVFGDPARAGTRERPSPRRTRTTADPILRTAAAVHNSAAEPTTVLARPTTLTAPQAMSGNMSPSRRVRGTSATTDQLPMRLRVSLTTRDSTSASSSPTTAPAQEAVGSSTSMSSSEYSTPPSNIGVSATRREAPTRVHRYNFSEGGHVLEVHVSTTRDAEAVQVTRPPTRESTARVFRTNRASVLREQAVRTTLSRTRSNPTTRVAQTHQH